MSLSCREARARLLDDHRGRLEPNVRRALAAHLATCADCAHQNEVERLLDDALDHRLPARPASAALRERIAAMGASAPRPRRWHGALVPALAVAAALVLTVPALVYRQTAALRAAATAGMVDEAVADHLRIAQAQRPLEVESGGIHQVRPWFEGRLDFAPVVPFSGDATVPLRGGALAYFRDRRAAAFIYGLRQHTITLLVFRADGLPWPRRGLARIGGLDAYRTHERGFTVILWRAGDLGYALVSDADPAEVTQVAARFSPGV
jgi:anti-sigma factor RsiW